MNNNNINTLTFENHDTYIYYVDEILKSEQLVDLIHTNPDNTDIVKYESFETTLFINGIKKGVIKYNTFDTIKLFNNFTKQVEIGTIITDDGILVFNLAILANKQSLSVVEQIKSLATYKSGKYANYLNIEIQIIFEDGYRIVTISY
jgi:hypothetical protein